MHYATHLSTMFIKRFNEKQKIKNKKFNQHLKNWINKNINWILSTAWAIYNLCTCKKFFFLIFLADISFLALLYRYLKKKVLHLAPLFVRFGKTFNRSEDKDKMCETFNRSDLNNMINSTYICIYLLPIWRKIKFINTSIM